MKELRALESVVDEIVRPQAVVVDRRDGEFPRKAIDALAEAGFLGLVSATDVGGGGLAEAVAVVERLGAACGSTAMVVLMHYAAVAVVEAYGAEETRREIAVGRHLTTLAFSEAGSRSHFWVPLGTAADADGSVRLDAGGAAFRKELGIERSFRDARAARVMAPTTDTLLDFIGRVTCGQPLFGDA